MCLFQFATCFEQLRAHHQENQLYQYNIWYMSLCVGNRPVTDTEWHIPDVVLIQLILLMMSTKLLETVSVVSLAYSHSLQSAFCHGGLQVHLCTCFLPNLTKFCSASCFSLFILAWFIFPCLLVLVYFRVFYPGFVSEYSLLIFCPSFSLFVQFYFYILPPFFLE